MSARAIPAVAFDLAIAARDALADEVIELRERVYWAESRAFTAEMMLDRSADLDDGTEMCLTQNGHAFAARRVECLEEAHY